MSGSNDNNNNGSATKASKLGRKGDPRMHRAVSARLSNPEISLFDALRVGGFDYPTNDDASVMDSEKVTLGQRKNQLSRRLRLAKKQQDGGGKDGSNNSVASSLPGGGSVGGHVGDSMDGNVRGRSSMDTSMDSAKDFGKQHSGGGSKNKGDKNITPTNTLASRALQMRQDNPDLTLADYEGDMEQNNIELNTDAPAKRQRIAKFHPDYAPLFVPPPARNSFGSAGATHAQNNAKGGGGGSNANNHHHSHHHHPGAFQNQPGNSNYPHNAGGGSGPQMPGMNMPGPPNANFMGTGPGGPFPNPSLFTQQISNVFNAQQAQQPRASGVAISSLSQSAQAVGMTLEQLAMTLASNPSKLAKLIASNESGGSKSKSDTMQKKHEVALSLYETECRSMYSKCMLMAGIDPRMCQPSTSSYLQFALKAWQAEGKRLHDMMGGGRNNNSGAAAAAAAAAATVNDPPLDAHTGKRKDDSSDSATTNTENQQQREGGSSSKKKRSGGGTRHSHNHDGHSHTHSHAHDHHNNSNDKNSSGGICEAPHVHRLDGQCGHKAIIHQPKDGVAHIDFVIGNKVECYNGIEPIGKHFDSIWPSKYKCNEYAENCNNNCARSNKAAHDKLDQMSTTTSGSSGANDTNSTTMNVPKIIPLSEINLQDPEWNYDVNGSIDGGVMGLFKLGGDRQGGEDLDNISTL